MGWKIIPGLQGRIYVPETQSDELKKHPCKECFSCQQCTDERCRLCRGGIKCVDAKNVCTISETPRADTPL